MTKHPTTTTLYFGPWYRRSPFFDGTQRAGCKAYDIYNKMYLPAEYDDPAVEYQGAPGGRDPLGRRGRAHRADQRPGRRPAGRLDHVPRSHSLRRQAVQVHARDGPSGGIVNDPVLVHPEENVWWMQLADSDAGLYALGVLSQLDLDAEVSYPDVHPCQVQGPLSGRTLAKLVGERHLRPASYYWCDHFEIEGIPVVITRTGWSAVPGFEVNLLDGSRGDEVWDAIMAAGEEFAIRPIAPNEARRVEAGIFNCGSDFTLADTPFHLTGLERLVEEQPQDYIGKEALETLRREGVDRKLVGIEFDSREPLTGITVTWPAHHDGRPVGRVTDAVWSPGLEQNIGYVWVPSELAPRARGSTSSPSTATWRASRPGSRSSTRGRSGRREPLTRAAG